MRLIEEYLCKLESQTKGKNIEEKRQLVQENYVPLNEYVDFSLTHNGYKDVLDYFKRKDGPPQISRPQSTNASMSEMITNGDNKKTAKLTISEINMKNDLDHKNNEKCDLHSKIY